MQAPRTLALALLLATSAHATPPSPVVTTAAQLTDSLRAEVDSLAHQVGSTELGAGVYTFPLYEPPARLSAGLGLHYSSRSTAPDREMPRGWRIAGVPEVQRDRRQPGRFHFNGAFSAVLEAKILANATGWIPVRVSTTAAGTIEVHHHATDDRWRIRTSDGDTVWLDAMDAATGSGSDEVTARWRATLREDAQGNRVEYVYDDAGRLVRALSGGAENDDGSWEGFLCTDFHYADRVWAPEAAAFGEMEQFGEVLRAVRVGRTSETTLGMWPPVPPEHGLSDTAAAPTCVDVRVDGKVVRRCAARNEPQHQGHSGQDESKGDDGHEGEGDRDPELPTDWYITPPDVGWLEPGAAPAGLAECWPFRDYGIAVQRRPGHELLNSIVEYGYADPFSPASEREDRVSFTYEDAQPDGFGFDGELPIGELGTTRQVSFQREHDSTDADDWTSNDYNPTLSFSWGSETTTALVDINGDARLDHVTADGESWTVRLQRRVGDGIDLADPIVIDGPALPLEVRRPVFIGRTGTGFTGPWGEEVCITDGDYDPPWIDGDPPSGVQWCMQHALDARIVTTQDLNGDGYPDVIAGSWVDPMQNIDTYSYTGQGFLTPEPGGFELEVYYGNGHGFDAPRLERAPFRATQIVKRDRKIQDTSEEDFDFPDRATTRVDLRDWNGDGWLDYVVSAQEDGDWRIWLHSGEEGGGWMPHLTPDFSFEPPWFSTVLDNTMGADGEEGPPTLHFTGLAGDLLEWFNPRPNEDYARALVVQPQVNEDIPGRLYGLTDLNGDGVLDFAATQAVGGIFANSTDPDVWHVWLGNGVDFEPRQTWSSVLDRMEGSNTEYDRHHPDDSVNGRYSSVNLGYEAQNEVKVQLIDVDGDGRLDQVVGNRGFESFFSPFEVWFRNLGDGFDDFGQTPPDWWWQRTGVIGSFDVGRRVGHSTMPRLADDLECGAGLEEFCECSVFAAAGELDRCDLAGVIDAGEIDAGEIEGMADRVWFDARMSETRSILRDVDGNGTLDALLVRFDGDDVQVRLGEHSVPHALKAVHRSEGLETTLAYDAASMHWPSGSVNGQGNVILDQQLPTPVQVVAETFSRDPVADAEGTTSTTFELGRRMNGALMGFETRRTVQRSPQHGWERVTAIEEQFHLDPDLPPELIERTVWAPESWGPNSCGSAKGLERDPFSGSWRLNETFASLEIDDGLDRRRLATQVVTTQRDPIGVTSRSWSTHIEWDEDWFQPLRATHDPGLSLIDIVETELGWTHRLGAPLSRLAERSVSGNKGPVEQVRWFYDGNSGLYQAPSGGLVTRVEQDAGWLTAPSPEAADAEVLAWDMLYGLRGELTRVEFPASGAFEETSWGFGSAVPLGSDDGLLPTSFAVDWRGRAYEARDLANGVTQATAFDGLDRAVATWVRDRAGQEHLLSSLVHVHDEPAGLTATTYYELGGVVDRTEMAIFDGRGNAVWAVTPGAEPGERIVAGQRTDLAGRVLQSFHPLSFGSLTPLVADASLHDIAGEAFFDGMGEGRLSFADQRAGLPPTRTCFPFVGTREITDPSGFEERFFHDERGQLIAVEQGGATTASYRWDDLGRLISFTSGEGNAYIFKHDLAGRLRRTTGDDFGWREFGYSGLERNQMLDSAGGSATWALDAHSRPQSLDITDPVDGLRTWSWTWDADWIGAVSQVAGPAATTGWAYDDLGREIARGRDWHDGFGQRLMTWDLDLSGRRVREDLVSGGEVARRWTQGWMTAMTVDLPKVGPVDVDFAYDEHGRRTEWSTSLGHRAEFRVDPAGRLGESSLIHGTTERRASWQWLDNGLLQSSQRTVATVGPMSMSTSTARHYGYDAMKRLTDVALGPDPWNVTTFESFEFLDDGAFVARTDSQGREFGYSTGPGAQVAAMVDLIGADHEEYEYDAAGRVDLVLRLGAGSWSSYAYDGLGQLRTATGSAGGGASFETSPDGAPIQRTRTAPDGSTSTEHILGTWRSKDGVETEAIAPIGYVDDHQMRWVLRGAEGHAEAVLDDFGVEIAHRQFTAYGEPLAESGDPADFDAFQGLDFDPSEGLMHAGVRSFSPTDGQWLQPEPLLMGGLVGMNPADPQVFAAYRYGRDAPTGWSDPGGERSFEFATDEQLNQARMSPEEFAAWRQGEVDSAITYANDVERLRGEYHGDIDKALGPDSRWAAGLRLFVDFMLFDPVAEHAAAMHPDSPQNPGALVLLEVVPAGKGKRAGQKLLTGTVETLADHHLLPRQFGGFFKKVGINIEKYTVTVGHQITHLRGIHGRGIGDLPGRWNQRWAKWVDANPNATAKDVFQQLGKMMDEYGLAVYRVHPYKK